MALNGPELERLDDLGRKHAKQAWIRGGRRLGAVSHEPPRHVFPAQYEGDESAWLQYRHGYRCELHNLNLALELAEKRAARKGHSLIGRA